jgi:hypothetical protein
MNAEAKKRYKDIDFPFICPVTKREFNSGKGLSVYLTKTLKVDHSEYYDNYINHRDSSCFFCGCKGTFISASKGYRNLCNSKICTEKSFKSHSVEGIMYRKFVSREEAEIIFEKENQKQLEKRTKTQNKLRKEDPLWDKKRSRNCKEFWIEKGYSEEESILKSKEVMNEIHQKTFDKFKSNPEKYASKYPTKIEYWLERGYSDEGAKVKLKERQTTFSKEVCIEKYGEKEGIKVWLERQEKWQKSLSKNGNIKGGFSKISQVLFYEIIKKYDLNDHKDIYFWTKNKEQIIKTKDKIYLYDYTDLKRKKIIEYNGDQYHANPKIYEKNSYPHPYHKTNNYTAEEIWKRDKEKIDLAKSKGYDVLVIWDSEYRKYPESTLEKCLNFLND